MIFSAGIKGGYLLGFLFNYPKLKVTNVPNQNSYGVTPMLGLHWQATPDMVFGIDLAWRLYIFQEKDLWEYKENDVKHQISFPRLGSNGPSLSIFGNYAF